MKWKVDQNYMIDAPYVSVVDLKVLIEVNNDEYDLIFDPILGDVVSCKNKPEDSIVSSVLWVEVQK